MLDRKRVIIRYVVLAVVFISASLLLLLGYRELIWEVLVRFYDFLTDKEKTSAYVSSFGLGAPLIFMLIQILQVIFAPVPGEATGFVGGYIFGILKGFVYSSVALTVGSVINFAIGRFIGKHYVRKIIPSKYLQKLDMVVKREGALVIFILFIIPGFPKDYLSLFLGVTALPVKVFVFIAAIGRMPGTFLLSLQGAMLFEQNYFMLGLAGGLCCLFVLLVYRYRESLYRWIEKYNQNNNS